MLTIFVYSNDERDQAKRAACADTIYALLFDIDQKLRSFMKHSDNMTDAEHTRMDEIRTMIADSGVLDLWE